MNAASKNCSRCDAPLTGHESACPKCKRPIMASSPTQVTKCPVCKIPAYSASLAGEDVLHCAECEGTAIKRESMMKLQPQGPKELLKGADERAHQTPPYFEKRQKPPILVCPFCGKRCKEEKLGPMNVDKCEKCSALWLDGKKISHLADIIGPYKWKASKGSPSSGSSRRRR